MESSRHKESGVKKKVETYYNRTNTMMTRRGLPFLFFNCCLYYLAIPREKKSLLQTNVE